MTLNSVDLPLSITTGYQNPNADFFSPVLACSCQFDVAVGFFTSGWLKDVLGGMHQLALNGGRCRFIVSPQLDPLDMEVILKVREPLLNENGLNCIEQLLFEQFTQINPDKREVLSNLISAGICEFKIAVPKRKGANLFHAKIGIAIDKNGDRLAFNGSFNFTANAKDNWEYIDIYRQDSERDQQRIIIIQDRFDCLWNEEDVFYDVTVPTKALKLNIDKYSSNYKAIYPLVKIRSPITLRPYQQQAIDAWGKNRGKGMFVMATGSGKTITALSAVERVITKLKDQNKPITIVFVLPLKHLLDQWHEEAQIFGLDAIKCTRRALFGESNYLKVFHTKLYMGKVSLQ